jgi:riboflavin biosynthesis pyrimidine reductase
LRAGLIDELSIVVTAALDGSTGAPTVFNSGDADLGPAPLVRMTLESHTVLEQGALWLRYRLGY